MCQKYTLSSGRLHDGKYFTQSLPDLEAGVLAAEHALKSTVLPAINQPVENFIVANATEKVIAKSIEVLSNHQEVYRLTCSRFQSIKSGIHSYVSETSIALELGDAAESIFEKARIVVDTFIRTNCPKAAEQVVAITERMNDGDRESLSSALTACRRLLATVADVLFPPQSEPYVDSKGKIRKAGTDAYKNRLLAYLEKRIQSSSTKSVVETQLDHLAARLDAVYEKACKGVHDDVDSNEARLTIIQTWLFLAELARFTAVEPQPVGPSAH
jgi:hypothetical protein